MCIPRLTYPTRLIMLLVSVSVLGLSFGIDQPVARGSTASTAGLPMASNLQMVDPAPWPMPGANPERTSWTPEEVRGNLKPLWYKPFEPYISQKVQIVAAYDILYISTASGLYAIDAETGAERWVYPTELPLGHSPTIANGVAYVGGFDRKLHAVDALTGEQLWTFEARAGFHTNPLVVEGKVYAGNRDGIFYAVYAEGPNTGLQAWQVEIGAPILYSAAYKDGVVFFGAEDSRAYGLDAETGTLVWKSAKLPGSGFHSFWPVIYRDRVIFSGSNNYGLGPSHHKLETRDIFPNNLTDPDRTLIGPAGTEPGDWAAGTPTIDNTRALDYLTAKPWRRTYFVLDRFTGEEREKAPVLWAGTKGVGGNRYPPVVGIDGVLYQQNVYESLSNYTLGRHFRLKIGTPFISQIAKGAKAADEPMAYSAGGNLIYWNLCCDRAAGWVDISIPWKTAGVKRDWKYFSYNLGIGISLLEMIPAYRQYHNPDIKGTESSYGSFGINGAYGWHGDQNAPVPYKGRIYLHRSNSLIAFDSTGDEPVALPMAAVIPAPEAPESRQGGAALKETLASEVQKMIDAGHLRPGYHSHGLFDNRAGGLCGDDLVEYWHQPADTIYTLLLALDHVSPDLKPDVEAYLQSEFAAYPPYQFNHVGWSEGASRDSFDTPPEVVETMAGDGLQAENYATRNSGKWGRNPFAFYAIWKYAAKFGDAGTILAASQAAFRKEFDGQSVDGILLENPSIHNAYIAGYLGYLELEKLAGNLESGDVRQELDRLLELRANNFSKDSAFSNFGSDNKPTELAYCRTLNIANNFMYLVPELAEYLRSHAPNKVMEAVAEYTEIAPYWFVSFAEEGFAEDYTATLYDGHALFMAKALIAKESGADLEKYLDIPGFARGDLFYIQKLVATIENYALAPNSAPVAEVDSANGEQDSPVVVDALANDVDGDGDPLRIIDTGVPNNGTVTNNGGNITYVPNSGFTGTDSFTYTISDGRGGTATGTVTVTVAEAITPPIPFAQPRINAPYSDGQTGAEQGAIAWFGHVNSTSNYADIRVLYTADALKIHVHVMDQWLWYDTTPSVDDLTNWDAVSLYLDFAEASPVVSTTSSYRFVAQLNHGQDRQDYQAAYQGDGLGWVASSATFTSTTGWRGSGLNDGSKARGWRAQFEIPLSSLGQLHAPASKNVWRMAVVLHDRDDSAGTALPDQSWPRGADLDAPSSWGYLSFGQPAYSASSAELSGVTKIRHGLNGVAVVDAHVGGHSNCGKDYAPNFFDGWGSSNYAGVDRFNIQNQWDIADWPCFSKYFITFPLDSVPTGKTIISATLTMYQFGNAGEGYEPGPEPSLIQALTVAEDWGESTISWNSAPLAAENVASAWVEPLNSYPGAPGIAVTWDVSQALSDAYSNGEPLRLALYSADLAYHSGKYFWSSDVADGNKLSRPTLDVTWGEPVVSSKLGDVNCDALSDAIDALFVLQADVGLRTPTTQCPPEPETLYAPNCDVSADGNCNVIDGLFILQCAVGVANNWCTESSALEPSPQNSPPEDDVTTAALTLVSALVESGETVNIPIRAAIPVRDIGAATVEVRYDPAVLQPLACTPDPDGVFDAALCNTLDGGVLRISLISTSGVADEHMLATVLFRVIGPAGETTTIVPEALVWTDADGVNMLVDTQSATVSITAPGSRSSLFLPSLSN